MVPGSGINLSRIQGSKNATDPGSGERRVTLSISNFTIHTEINGFIYLSERGCSATAGRPHASPAPPRHPRRPPRTAGGRAASPAKPRRPPRTASAAALQHYVK
jgi:hypothetical protein